jgi:hypothetical protein
VRNALTAVGAPLDVAALAAGGVVYDGMFLLGAGDILVGMILAAIAAYTIDHNWKGAIAYSLFGAACAWVGFIHSAELRWVPAVSDTVSFATAWGPTLGYLGMAALLAGMMVYNREATPRTAPPAKVAAGAD